MRPKTRLFYCSADADRAFRDELDKHLATLKQERGVETWHPNDAMPGVNVETERYSQLQAADVIVLLLSRHLLDSCKEQIAIALERHSVSQVTLIPVKVSPVDLQDTLLEKLQALPKSGKPISTIAARQRDKVWMEVAQAIRNAIQASPWRGDMAIRERDGVINKDEWFAYDLTGGYDYLEGPLVITYLQPKSILRVCQGAPWHIDEYGIPPFLDLRGDSFRGEFFVRKGWSVCAESTEQCICSGYYTQPGLPLGRGPHELPEGARFYYNFGRDSYVFVPLKGPELERRKAEAIKAAECLLQVRLIPSAWSEPRKADDLYTHTDVEPQY